MDTVLLQQRRIEKTAMSAAGVSIALCLIIFQSIISSANSTDLGIYTGLSPTLNYIKEEQIEKENIEESDSEQRLEEEERQKKFF